MGKDKMLPCPFCDHKVSKWTGLMNVTPDDMESTLMAFRVVCDYCETWGPPSMPSNVRETARQSAIEAWNERPKTQKL